MKYSWIIDQRAAIESGFGLDVIDLSIFALLKDFAAEPGCKKMNENGHTYHLFSWKLVTQQQPVLGLNTKRSVTRRFEKLAECNVMHPHPDNKGMKLMWYRFGEGAVKLMRSTRNENTSTRNENSYSLGITVPSTRNENSQNNIIIDNSIKNKREESPANLDFFNPNKHEETATYLISHFEKPENAMWLNGMANGNWKRAVKGYCLKLQKLKRWNDLQIPKDDGQHYIWAGEMLAGIKSWYTTAAEIDRSNGRQADAITIKAIPTPQPSRPTVRASAAEARKLAGYE